MALPFAVGDFLACIALCREIFDNCVNVEGAPKSHNEFKTTARHLQAGLEQIIQIISERNDLAKTGAKPGEFCENPNDRATSDALREITADFSKTLEHIRRLLKQHPISEGAGFVRKLMYWIEAEDDINELLTRCKHHITTINFLLEPFRT